MQSLAAQRSSQTRASHVPSRLCQDLSQVFGSEYEEKNIILVELFFFLATAAIARTVRSILRLSTWRARTLDAL